MPNPFACPCGQHASPLACGACRGAGRTKREPRHAAGVRRDLPRDHASCSVAPAPRRAAGPPASRAGAAGLDPARRFG
ncbi:MAG: hypothetical protein AVDCRST_MAG27-3930 [uncultured Craurococcus sp.]|uniref:Uncharacterized protein n=1 Tax=uncultured Craurococcus sp. TaxID=1135998 RepID=A0A6J4JK64_9PROT|nr:MAG: hypothetical protein AVDCRST_MAG27-3930 [uncultured Craurococcus sp.]